MSTLHFPRTPQATLTTINNLGATRSSLGELDGVEETSQSAEASHESTINFKINLGAVYRSLRRIEDSKSMLEGALRTGMQV